MNDLLMQTYALAAGLLLGAFFFGGLWLTVRKAVLSRHLAAWFIASKLLRMGVVLGGFYFIGRGHWARLAACLAGFVIARFIVLRLTRTPVESNVFAAKEGGHAP